MSNPAQRLHALLKRAKRKELANNKMLIGWRNVLALPAAEVMDDLMVMSKVGKVFTLPSIITTCIKRFPDLPAELFLGWRDDLFTAFRAVNFNATFGNFSNHLSDSLLNNIAFCAHELEKRTPEKDISKEQLDEIRQSAWSLYEEILKSDLPPNLCGYLLDYLYRIIEAIDDYEITGAAGLERSLNEVIGSIVTDTETAKQTNESSFGKQFWWVVTRVAVLLKIGKTALEIEEGVRKLLQ